MRYIPIVFLALALTGCSSSWQKVNCGWTNQVLPIKPSRKDKLTVGTTRQIVAANTAQEQNCR